MIQPVHFAGTTKAAARPVVVPSRTNDPARTMAGILAVATREFAAKGLSGGRIDVIGQIDGRLQLEDMAPAAALRRLVEFTLCEQIPAYLEYVDLPSTTPEELRAMATLQY